MKSKHTILVVDDEKTNVKSIVNILQDKYNIKTAPNGEVALKILNKFDIALVLLDIQMPVLDGYETIIRIKKQQNLEDIPVIFLTANNDSDSLIQGFELGAKDYITKPFNAKELEVRVQNHLQTYDLINQLEYALINIEKLIESQDNIIILTNGKQLQFANKKFFDFFGFEDLDDFLQKQQSIAQLFEREGKFFDLNKAKHNENWIEQIEILPSSKRIVAMRRVDSMLHIFSVSINQYDKDIKIVTFSDITETMRENQELHNKTIHDNLTGTYNREFFDKYYQKIINDYDLKENKLAVALLDIDHFKKVNDTFGHDVGDTVLKEFVNTIQQYSREEDILIRWGGEEFILLLKVKSIEAFNKALEHFRKVIELQNFTKVGKKTCSIGGTLYQNKEDIQKTIKRADEALYDAKSGGRNQVVII